MRDTDERPEVAYFNVRVYCAVWRAYMGWVFLGGHVSSLKRLHINEELKSNLPLQVSLV